MLESEFENILEARINKIRETLKSKAKEYATKDRLHNFKIAARICDVTTEQALWGMASKHLVSILDMVFDSKDTTPPPPAMVDEKIGDMINYLILLEAVFLHRIRG